MKTRSRFSKIERDDILQMSKDCLWGPEGEVAREYLLVKRQLSEDIIRSFKLGYLPNDLNHQLRGRIIIPLFDASGNLVVITSRTMTEESYLPKYWHETYEKSMFLFGADLAKKWMRKYRFALVVEGQFDVMQLHKAGMKNTIGLCSTNMSDMQYAIICRYCDEVVLMLDQDSQETRAGQKGVEKIMQKVWSPVLGGDLNSTTCPKYKIRPLILKNAKDPDEYVTKYGFDSLRENIHQVVQELRNKYVYA